VPSGFGYCTVQYNIFSLLGVIVTELWMEPQYGYLYQREDDTNSTKKFTPGMNELESWMTFYFILFSHVVYLFVCFLSALF
jgi:hypothetical protein